MVGSQVQGPNSDQSGPKDPSERWSLAESTNLSGWLAKRDHAARSLSGIAVATLSAAAAIAEPAEQLPLARKANRMIG